MKIRVDFTLDVDAEAWRYRGLGVWTGDVREEVRKWSEETVRAILEGNGLLTR